MTEGRTAGGASKYLAALLYQLLVQISKNRLTADSLVLVIRRVTEKPWGNSLKHGL